MFSGRSAALVPVTIFRAADAPAQPLTLTVEQTAVVLGVSRSTTYELVGSGGPEIRLRRRIVVPVAHFAERLGGGGGVGSRGAVRASKDPRHRDESEESRARGADSRAREVQIALALEPRSGMRSYLVSFSSSTGISRLK